ncbi:MAG: ComEC/Rec2 family competence protein [Christensenellaceae bacterium]|nr:ComEC/Rec2 family competence protein [Christensenellaceae bacterium]
MTTKEECKYIDRPFNIRPLCFWGGIVAFVAYLATVSFTACACFVFAVFVLLVCLQFVKTKDAVVTFLGTSRIFFVGAVILCIAVMLSFGITNLVWSSSKSYAGIHSLDGVVESFNFRPTDQGASYMSLSNAKFDGKPVSGRVIVFVSGYDNGEVQIEVGRRVEVSSRLSMAVANAMNVNNKTRYTANTKYDDIAVLAKSRDFRHVVLRHTRTFFGKYLSPTNATLMYSMVFGDKSALEDEVRNDFAINGMAHALAVSGLHVGVLIAMLSGLLRLCRVRRRSRVFAIVPMLLFYCYLCGFAFPVIRASIMFSILLCNTAFLRVTDLLSSICMAGILTLLIFPYAILSISFQLSYTCMLGIAILYRPIENLLKRTIIQKAPRSVMAVQTWVIKAVTMCLCADISLFPLIVKYFKAVPVFSLFGNLIILPLLILAFQVAVISLVTWVGFFLLYPIEYLLVAVRWMMSLTSRVPFARMHLSNGGAWFLSYFLAIILMSRFVFLPRKYKYPTVAVLLCVYTVGFFV